MTRWGLLAACALIAAPTMAKAPERPAPKLIVAISVDQLSADLFDEYRPMLFGGLGRLARQGTVFRNGYQSHNATETCPGHSTIMTGSHPSRNGIIANTWFDLSQAREDKAVYCAEDEKAPGSSTSNYVVSPVHLKVPTLGELWRKVSPGARNVAVAGKDRAAVMMSGHVADQRWYWNGKTYATDIKDAPVPVSVGAAQQAVAKAIAEDRPALQMPALCQSKSRVIPVEGGGTPVGNFAFARKAGDARAFRATPEFDGATLALAAALINEMKLGQGPSTDVISIGASATDYVGHSYGTEGAEMCLQLFSLDRDLGDFFAALDAKGLDYMVVLTADHGGQDIPERKREQGVPGAARTPQSLYASNMGRAIADQLGVKGPVLHGEGAFGDVYIDRSLSPADRARVKAAALAAYKAQPMVEAVLTREELKATPVPTGDPTKWTLLQRARASFDDQRSGDLIVQLKRDITPIADTKGYVATHGSPWDYDRRVPILFWRRGMTASERTEPVETVDIMPTLAAALGLSVDRSTVDGHCLSIDGISCPLK